MIQKSKPYLVNFILLSVILTIIAIIMEFTPFGKETMLTVDLGQQYIDFFSLFRYTLLEEPEMLLYSFEKAFGGEMIGLWAYYLMSPFNLIFLFFDESNMELAVTVITYLKVMASSLTMMYFTRSKYELNLPSSLIFSISYALMSYVIVYLLNIMWLDGLVLLPLIALGLDRIVKKPTRRPILYVVTLTFMLISSYYIGYMVCIFLAMYAFFVIIENQTEFNWKQTTLDYLQFIKYSIISALISCITLLPTIMSLAISKGQHAENEFANLDVAHSLQDMASKLFIGSFNFDEMSSGSPNLYAGMLVLLLVLFYFFNHKIKLSEKITALLILGVFFLSFRYELIDKLWHGGQFPIWYHFRFSFTTTFFAIVLAIRSYKYQPKSFSLPLLIGGLIFISAFSYYYFTLNEYTFLSDLKIFLSFMFFVVFLVILQFGQIKMVIRQFILLALVLVEMTTNTTLILSEMSYVDVSKFADYTETLNEATSPLKHGNNDFYRINKTFMRTKNEAMYVHYNGMDHFGSTIEAHVPELYGYLGLPDGNGFGVYTNGTLFTDDFFNIRYLLDVAPNDDEYTSNEEYNLYPEATDLDIQAHPMVDRDLRYVTHENVERLGLAIEVAPDIVGPTAEFIANDPIHNQELLLSLIDFAGTGEPYFQYHDFNNVTYSNAEVTDRGDGDYFTYESTAIGNEDAYVELSFDTPNDNPYYFTIPSQFDDDNVELTLNGQQYRFYDPFRRRQLTNASYGLEDGNQRFRFTLVEDELQANLVNLYEFNEERYDNMITQKQDNLFEVSSFKHNYIEGSITTEQEEGYLLFSIPYDQNWKVTIDGERVETQPVLNDTLMAVPISAGTHDITLHYFPSAIYYGAGLSILGVSVLILDRFLYRRKKENTLYEFKKVEIKD